MATLINNSEHKALTTLARAKSFAGISGDSQDTALTILINQVSGFIESYLKRRLLEQAYTDEKYDGTGSDTLVLAQFPVSALTRLQVNAALNASPSWQTIESTRYVWYTDGRIRLQSGARAFLDGEAGTFLEEPQKYRATYTAGYKIDFDNENDPAQHTLPADIEYACVKLVSAMQNTRKNEGLKSAKVGDIAMTFRDEVYKDSELKEILGKYVAATI